MLPIRVEDILAQALHPPLDVAFRQVRIPAHHLKRAVAQNLRNLHQARALHGKVARR